PLVERYGVVPVTAWAHIAGAALAWPLAIGFILRAPAPPTTVLYAVVGLAVGTSFINYLLWGYALSRLKAAAVAVSTNLQPVLVGLLTWLIGTERPTPLLIAGGILVLGGVSLALSNTHRRP